MKIFPLLMAIMLTAAAGLASADDGAITNKNTSRNAKLTVEPETIGESISHAEHAFIDMMKFYVPMQAASGATGEDLVSEDKADPREYYNIDDTLVETIEVAKPLISVFIYGPAIGVEDTPFAHSFMDTFGAVSLDDGMTWKTTNLSDSADKSSFELGSGATGGGEGDTSTADTQLLATAGNGGSNWFGGGSGGGKGSGKPVPDDHTVPLANDDGLTALHADGYKHPYKHGCTDCHGETLEGSSQGQSCYNCHETAVWQGEPAPVGPIIDEAEWEDKRGGLLKAKGSDAPSRTLVEVINAVTKEVLDTDQSNRRGKWRTLETNLGTAPCTIAAVAEGLEGPAMVPEGTPEDCVGPPEYVHDLTEYPGGVSNVFHATAGNKVLVAWPSRYCQVGKPAYSFAWDGDDNEGMSEELIAKQVGLAEFLEIDVTTDLYLADLFGVAGSQGSQDFADEGYPQTGEVPFRCVWTARGVLVNGDDPRTDDVEEATHMEWFKAERLTSGRRDPNRIEVKGVKGAGFAITWQEDPEGLRPGDGEGPGEGWSGAVAHHKTDVWYSFINWENFDLVEQEDEDGNWLDPINLADYLESFAEDEQVTKAQVGVPMAVPMRITNNAKCQLLEDPTDPEDKNYFSYCNYEVAQDYGLKNYCATTIVKETKNDTTEVCITEDGLPLIANTASTRPRLGLQGFDSDGDGSIDDAWVVFAAEESKGLGGFYFYANDLTPCNEGDAAITVGEDTYQCEEADIGKNQWYYSYNMGEPATFANLEIYGEYSLVANVVSQGNLLNQPEVDWRTGEFYPVLDTLDLWDLTSNGESENFDMYNTEIARRASLLIQSIGKAEASENGLLAMSTWKQGAMNQGGPADTMLRRIVLSAGGDPAPEPCNGDSENDGDVDGSDLALFSADYGRTDCSASDPCNGDFDDDGDVDGSDLALFSADYGRTDCPVGEPAAIDVNPYAFENMVCENWLIEAGTNPYYPGGVCGEPATNLSGVIPDACVDTANDGADVDCPTVDFSTSTFGIGSQNPILQGKEIPDDEKSTTKVIAWHQCPSEGVAQIDGDITPVTCGETVDGIVTDDNNLDDQSWYNPLDVSKGHRGFIDGDFVMVLYAWSPNWKLNAKGSDRYELYVRRSFDGGETWTTTPSTFTASDGLAYTGDGTVTCESYRRSDTGSGTDSEEPKVCYEFAAGAAEHARNITQHKSMRITTLDPRYAPTAASIVEGCVDTEDPTMDDTGMVMTCDDGLDDEGDSDLRDPSRYFMVFETGDNTTSAVGEAEPMDLFYGRGESFGDDYVVWAETDTGTDADAALCYPSDPHDVEDVSDVLIDSGFCNEFDNANTGGDTHSSEANMEGNSDGSKMYAVWTQWVFDEEGEEEIESDAMARRVWWIDGYISDTEAWSLPGTSQSGTPDPEN